MDYCEATVSAKTVEELTVQFKPFDIRYNLEKYKLEYPQGLLRKASVLIPLQLIDGEYHLILTVRSKNLTHHAGYVAFPGGMQDDSDSDEIHTALREAEEEIGLKAEHVQIIAVFSPSIVRPNSLVYPVLGVVSNEFIPVANAQEVALVFKLPLKRFLTDERRRISDFNSPLGSTYHVHHFIDCVDGKEVDTWGFTANLCVITALGVYQTDQTFCFYENFKINKDNLLESHATKQVIEHMLKLASKL